MSLKVKKAGRFYTFLLLIILIAAAVFLNSRYLRVTNITVSGNEVISEAEIVKMAGIVPNASILMLDEAMIKENVERDGRLAVRNVERIFPQTVCIHVTEREAVAQILHHGKYLLIDETGCYMTSKNEKQSLPEITGVEPVAFNEGHVINVGEGHQQALLSIVKAIGAGVEPLGVTRIDMEDTGDIYMLVNPQYRVVMGSAYKAETKLRMAKAFIKECNDKGLSGGDLDVRDADNYKGYYSSPQPSATPAA